MKDQVVMSPNNGQLDRYFKRTVEHIHRVQKNMLTIVNKYGDALGMTLEDKRICMHNVFKHDHSKFSETQFIPYVHLTEYYHQRRVLGNKDYQYPEGIKEQVDKAVDDHYRQENHHPERFIDASGTHLWGKYSFHEAVETVCDLQAMADEFREGTCRKYYEEIWKPKHCKNIPDDFNWQEVQTWMDAVIQCFEKEQPLQ